MFVQIRTESYSRYAEEITMTNDRYALDLVSFIDEVMSPTESLTRMLMDTNRATSHNNRPEVKAEDVSVVVGALSSLSRHRLHEFARHLQLATGGIEVEQPSNYESPVDVQGVIIGKNVSEKNDGEIQ